ncbi:hypothetical protein PMI22_02165 [Pseudomonas sp. GM21]|uniref:NEL-type E3 ubiquitin ligase domain-containing protein n=1 Tax=Pseudomonas sp. GM21 TaxID=1144325 RepID=UPI0002727A4C|nr:NEL-type E3 ubiquitin ligase domain-containing protein [Pseudomonas sp. GM21]EJM21281.1 hypothetical protein PMI22_02165 [Pseudomonas sp. GM21]
MSDLQGRITADQEPDTLGDNGRHYVFIKSRIPLVFKSSSLKRARELSSARISPATWITTASQHDHSQLQDANLKLWTEHNSIDQLFNKLQNVYEFAEPLLSAALKQHYGVEDDVKTTFLHLYLPKQQPWYAIDISKGVVTRTVSLLDAALHNFARSETCEADSDFISQPDERGLFDIKPIKRKMSIAQFQTLCRELDIGARYNQYLQSMLLPDDAVAKTLLKKKVVRSQKAAFVAAAQLAVVTGDIGPYTRDVVLAMLEGERNLKLKGKHLRFHELSMLDTALTGIVLIAPDLDRTWQTEQVIAYVPQDPEHPLKSYPSLPDFLNELTRQLRENKLIRSSGMTYRQYFSQFVPHQQRGLFFAELQQNLTEVRWHKKEPLDQRPPWREEPVSHPRLHFRTELINGGLWTHLYQQKLNKILNDARHIAVSTADADSNARWAWWDNFKKIVSDIFNVALIVITPFVPFLGELMMVYTAYQITSDVVESIVDMAEGLWTEAAEHMVEVVTNIIQLAAIAAGAELGKFARLRLSPLIEGMKPVRLPNGQSRLWHPDLTPYEQPGLTLPDGSQPDDRGLHSHKGQSVLPLEGKHYAVQHQVEQGRYRIKHPQRANAYLPELKTNGLGAWTHEGETPQDWEGPTLMRRLGHDVDGFSDAALERVRIASGTDDDALRRMYIDNAPPPPLLADSLQRLKIDRQIDTTIEQIRAGQPLEPNAYWFESLVTYLDGWPAEKALKVYQNTDLTGPFHQYGNGQATDEQTLATSLTPVMSGQLAQSVVDFLSEAELEALLGPQVAKGDRVQALRNRLGDEAGEIRTDIFTYLYQAGQTSDDPRIGVLRQTVPELTARTAETLLTGARGAELERLSKEQRPPLRLKTLAREAAFEARLSHAYEGFYADAQWGADTERLVLNTLRLHSDTFAELRIEVREGAFDGLLRCSVGADDATTVRLLIREESGQYEVRDGANNKLHEAEDFMESVLHAMPTNRRQALGYRPGQGLFFKQWIMAKTEMPSVRRTLLAEPPNVPVLPPETITLLRGPLFSKPAATLEDRVSNLYPNLNKREVETFARSLNAKEEPFEVMSALENELKRLRQTLDRWMPLSYSDPFEGVSNPEFTDYMQNGGSFIADRLLQCFERRSIVFGERSASLEGGYALDLSAELKVINLDQWWDKLPDIQHLLDQVTTLTLDRATFNPRAGSLLEDFPQLEQLSARDCRLAHLPAGIDKMHFLRTLRLTDNHITLTPDAVEILRNLTRMETLRLDENPELGLLPNVERMPNLMLLSLSNTGVTRWPDGLFEKRRPRGFFLDLMENPLTELPTVVPGSEDARIVARTRLFAKQLSDVNRVAFEEYRKSVGLSRGHIYLRAAEHAINAWPMSDDSRWWTKVVAGLGTFKEEAWHDLMSEPGSKDFFALIEKLKQSADYRAGGALREQLSGRVWRMIEAMDLDAELRTELFEMTSAPTTCADAGAQLFNNMGIKVLTTEAYALSTSAAILESRLVTLAKGAARLARVDDIAGADVRSRTGNPDEVEVYLAYETGLAYRLGLPWQSNTMLYEPTAGVSARTLDTAFDTVISMEVGDGLVNEMIEQPFWEKYLREAYPDAYSRNARIYRGKPELLDQLRDAQRTWVHSARWPEVRRAPLRRQLQDLADQLPVPHSVVLTGAEMTDAVYERLLNEIGYDEKALSRRLTREALQKADPSK